MRFSLLALLLIGAGGIRRRHPDVPLGRAAALRRARRQGAGSRWRSPRGPRSACSPRPAAASAPSRIIAEYTPPAQPDERLLPRASTPATPQPEPAPPAPAATPGAPAPPDDAASCASAGEAASRDAQAGADAAGKPTAPDRPPPEDRRRPAAAAAPNATRGETVDHRSARTAAARARVVAAGHAGAHRRGHVRAAAVRFGRGVADRAGRRADGSRARDRARGSAQPAGHVGAGARRRSRAARAQPALRRRRSRRLPDPAGTLPPAHRLRAAAGGHAEGRSDQDPLLGRHASRPAATTAPSTISGPPAFRSTARATWSRRASA